MTIIAAISCSSSQCCRCHCRFSNFQWLLFPLPQHMQVLMCWSKELNTSSLNKDCLCMKWTQIRIDQLKSIFIRKMLKLIHQRHPFIFPFNLRNIFIFCFRLIYPSSGSFIFVLNCFRILYLLVDFFVEHNRLHHLSHIKLIILIFTCVTFFSPQM